MRQRRDRRQRWALLPALTELPALSELTAVAAWRSPDRCHACVFPMFSSEVNRASACACAIATFTRSNGSRWTGGSAAADHATVGSRGLRASRTARSPRRSNRSRSKERALDDGSLERIFLHRTSGRVTGIFAGLACAAFTGTVRTIRLGICPAPLVADGRNELWRGLPGARLQRIRRAEGGEVGSWRPSTP
jgi:hypothetical protein